MELSLAQKFAAVIILGILAVVAIPFLTSQLYSKPLATDTGVIEGDTNPHVCTASYCVGSSGNDSNYPIDSALPEPPIVNHFACSDYCPGPAEQYVVKIYDGVQDEAKCLQLGGEPRTYFGWGEHHICVVK